MASEAAVTNPNSEDVEKELKPEAKVMEPVQISLPKESVNCPEPEEVALPVASSAEPEETRTEPFVTESTKGIDTDEYPKAGESVVLVEESQQKNDGKQGEVPPGEEEKKIEDASDNNNTVVEKVLHPEPDVNSLSKESVVEKIEGEPEEKLDTRTVEKQEESKAEPPVENKLCEPEKVVEVSKQLPAKRAAREYIGDIEVLPNEEMEESEAELTKVEKAEKKKDELEKVFNSGEQASIEAEPEDKLDTETVEKHEESKIKPSLEEKLCEPENIVEVSKPLPARVFIGNIEVSPDEEMEESEGDLAKIKKADGEKDELEKVINDGEQSSIKGEAEEKLDAEAFEKQEGSKVEPSVEEKLGEQLVATRAAREYIGNVEVLPDEDVEEPEVGLAKVENIEEKKGEREKLFNAGEQSSIEAIEENVDKNPGEQVQPIDEKEVKGADSKPEEISETEPAEKLEQSTGESVEEKPREPGETVHVPVQLSLDPVEGKVEILEELPVKEVEVSVEKKGMASEAEPAEKQEEFKVKPVCEKVDEPTETLPAKVEETAVKEVDDPETVVKPGEISGSKNVESVEKVSVEPVKVVDDLEQSSVKEKVEELPSKEAEAHMEKKVIIPESECKQEEILDAEPSQKPDEPKDELTEKKPDEPTEIVKAVEEGDKCIEKVEELPASIVEEIRESKDQEANVSEVESKPAEISETKPIESVEEKSVEPDIVDVPLQASVLEKPGEAEEWPAKEIDIKDEKLEGIPETKPADDLEVSEVASVEAKPELIKIVDVQEQSSPEIDKDKTEIGVELPIREVEAISEKENEVPEAEFKHDKISETEPAEKKDESKLQLVEESLSKPTKIVGVPEESVKEVVEEKVGSKEELLAKGVDAPAEDLVKVSEYDNKPEEINETKPVETIEKELVEPEKIVDVAVEEKSEKVEELPAKERESPVETEAKVLDSGFKPEEISASTPEEKLAEQSEVTGQHEKELPAAVPSEKEPEVLVSEIKPEEIFKFTPEEKLIDQCEVTEQSDKEPPAAESVEKEAKNFEAELKPEEISESTPKEIPVKQSEIIIEQSEKEAAASEPVEDLAEKVDKTGLSNKAEPAIVETQIEEVSAKTDEPNEQKDSLKKSEEIDPLPEEKVADSGKTELVTEPQEGKSVASREFTPCEEAKPTESETTEKAENGNTKNEAAVEGNRDEETTKEAEKCELATQTDNIGRSLKDKLDQEKRDDETTKTDVQTEATNESEDTKVPEDASKEEVPAKTTQKQSHNIMKMVKHSLVKAKKAIIGKSSNSKAPASEVNADEVSK